MTYKSKDQQSVTLGARVKRIPVPTEKVYINDHTPYWHNGDAVMVNSQSSLAISNASGGSAEIAGVTGSTDGYRAVYPASLVTTDDITSSATIPVDLPADQHFQWDATYGCQIVQLPMGAYSNGGTTLQFRNLCSIVRVTVSNNTGDAMTLDNIRIETGSTNISGPGTATVSGSEDDAIIVGNEGERYVDLSFSGEEQATLTSGASRAYYIVVPPFQNNDVSIIVETATKRNIMQKNNVSLAGNTIVTVTDNVTTMETDNTGALRGGFTINAAGDRVRFAQGNLQYNATGSHAVAGGGTATGTWRFAEHQYDALGLANMSNNTGYTGWTDLFGWGASGYNDPSDADQLYYEPASTASTQQTNSGNNYYGYGPSLNNGTSTDLGGTNFDWGVYNAISNGGNQPGLWRTLTKDEWVYLLNTRRSGVVIGNEQHARYCKAKINNVRGLLIFPDDLTWPSGMPTSIYHLNSGDGVWSYTTEFTMEQFTTLEDLGCVFLPCGGYRFTTQVNYADDNGAYASATHCDNRRDYQLLITGNSVTPGNILPRSYGLSVRLVQDF